ncbi:MAG: deoxyribose-phosphate aldolase [Chlorobi bacterium]|nr:MAG: deoxyribose-phosphate aldolase [Bacteroidota bacterium]MBE2266329.1 deoxyribose-phosphate aldolase [Flavobacteriales bacterium]MBL1162097.1 deoxyribose-phosphate aldolase [Chlorobiota bacterium]MBW7854574.1 deoxyribose-phosphate aldolase [Candidatus Kapabacteria bacterium]MCC6331935.1 deoxyribose-phosphate aldolase [Ignavibacteria bacterium]
MTSDNIANIADFIDHTVLKPDSTIKHVEQLCAEATQYNFASVCILPRWVEHAASLFSRVCTVVGFPLGASATSVKVFESVTAIQHGATEIDVVASVTSLKSGRFDEVFTDISEVTNAVHSEGKIVKVIIEACLLSHDEKLRMCEIVSRAGADYIKTSTGFSAGGATIADVELLKQHVAPDVLVKASGGIRDADTARAMIRAGASRLGTSSGIAIVTAKRQ